MIFKHFGVHAARHFRVFEFPTILLMRLWLRASPQTLRVRPSTLRDTVTGMREALRCRARKRLVIPRPQDFITSWLHETSGVGIAN